MPELPSHLYVGRGNFSGPVLGGYVMYSFGPFSYGAAATDTPIATTAVSNISFPVPCDTRLERIQYSARSFTGTGATDTFFINFYKGTAAIAGTDLATLGTPLTSSGATAVAAKAAISVAAYANYVDQSGSGIATFSTTAGVRDITKGQYLYASVYGGVNTIAPKDINVQFVGFITGHPNADSTND